MKALTIKSASWNYYYPLTKRRCQKQPDHFNLKPSLAPNAIGWLSGRLFAPFGIKVSAKEQSQLRRASSCLGEATIRNFGSAQYAECKRGVPLLSVGDFGFNGQNRDGKTERPDQKGALGSTCRGPNIRGHLSAPNSTNRMSQWNSQAWFWARGIGHFILRGRNESAVRDRDILDPEFRAPLDVTRASGAMIVPRNWSMPHPAPDRPSSVRPWLEALAIQPRGSDEAAVNAQKQSKNHKSAAPKPIVNNTRQIPFYSDLQL